MTRSDAQVRADRRGSRPNVTRSSSGVRRRRFMARRYARLAGLHADETGSISVASVFALLMLTVLLGLVMNSARQADQKVRLQNAADAATWSGGTVLARGMNTVAFTNHLLADVFALTAYMREARNGDSAALAPEILDNWERIGPFLSTSEYPPFAELGSAVVEKVPHEREVVATFSVWSAAASQLMLPVLETILAEEQIPEFQRALVALAPLQAQIAADEAARRHGQSWPRPVELHAVLWRTSGDEAGGPAEAHRRTLPAVDPVLDFLPTQPSYQQNARSQRAAQARRYLADWNNETLSVFDRYGKMSQFSNLWRIFTCGQLRRLLEVEYPQRNLPMQIRFADEPPGTMNEYLERDFMFVGVVYRPRPGEFVPGTFRNPSIADRQAYAQVEMYVPQRRLIWVRSGGGAPGGDSIGGVPGDILIDPPPAPPPAGVATDPTWVVGRESGAYHPERWDLATQNWRTQLVPAVAPAIPRILSTPPSMNGVTTTVAPYQTLTPEDLPWLGQH